MSLEACKPNVLFMLPPGWDALSKALFGHAAFNVLPARQGSLRAARRSTISSASARRPDF